MRRLASSLAIFFLLAMGTGAATACNVPVFRYALERWNKRNAEEQYSLFVFHDAPLSEVQLKELSDLETRIEDPSRPVNLMLYVVNVAQEIVDPALAKIWKQEQRPEFRTPWMVLRLPDAWGLERTLHAGPFDRSVLETWLQSRFRNNLARSILQGHSAVFVLLESKDTAKNQDALERVSKRLAEAEKTGRLPELTDAPKDRILREDIPLKVSFKLLTLSRDDVAEKPLIDMLIAMDPDSFLKDDTRPALIPIYGRGIAMVDRALIGEGITDRNLTELIDFLLGACSCEVRRLNPGIELLTSINWDGPAPNEVASEPASTFPGKATATERPPREGYVESTAPVGAPNDGGWRNILWVLGGVLVVLVSGSMIILARRKPID